MVSRDSVFISYRRSDTSGAVQALFRAVSDFVGKDRVFKDTSSIKPGDDFSRELTDTLGRSAVVLAVIGPGWYEVDEWGKRRLDDSDDWVRRELSQSLSSPDVEVIPVLVDGGKLAPRERLPTDIAALVDHQALRIAMDTFETDVSPLLDRIGELVQSSSGTLDPSGSLTFARSEYLPLRVDHGSIGYLLGYPPPDGDSQADDLTTMRSWIDGSDTAGDAYFVTGPIFSGKTTLMAEFARSCREEGLATIIAANIHDAGQTRRTVLDSIVSQLLLLLDREPRLAKEPEHLSDQLKSLLEAWTDHHDGSLVIIVDAIDESADAGTQFLDSVSLPPPPGVTIVVSGRSTAEFPQGHYLVRDPKRVLSISTSDSSAARKSEADAWVQSVAYSDDAPTRTIACVMATIPIPLAIDELDDLLREYSPNLIARFVHVPSNARWIESAPPWDQRHDVNRYRIGHEYVVTSLRNALGRRSIASMAERIAAWQDEYEQLDWPATTPPVLFSESFLTRPSPFDGAPALDARQLAVLGANPDWTSRAFAYAKRRRDLVDVFLVAISDLCQRRREAAEDDFELTWRLVMSILVIRRSALPSELVTAYFRTGAVETAIELASDSAFLRADPAPLRALLACMADDHPMRQEVGWSVFECFDTSEFQTKLLTEPNPGRFAFDLYLELADAGLEDALEIATEYLEHLDDVEREAASVQLAKRGHVDVDDIRGSLQELLSIGSYPWHEVPAYVELLAANGLADEARAVALSVPVPEHASHRLEASFKLGRAAIEDRSVIEGVIAEFPDDEDLRLAAILGLAGAGLPGRAADLIEGLQDEQNVFDALVALARSGDGEAFVRAEELMPHLPGDSVSRVRQYAELGSIRGGEYLDEARRLGEGLPATFESAGGFSGAAAALASIGRVDEAIEIVNLFGNSLPALAEVAIGMVEGAIRSHDLETAAQIAANAPRLTGCSSIDDPAEIVSSLLKGRILDAALGCLDSEATKVRLVEELCESTNSDGPADLVVDLIESMVPSDSIFGEEFHLQPGAIRAVGFPDLSACATALDTARSRWPRNPRVKEVADRVHKMISDLPMTDDVDCALKLVAGLALGDGRDAEWFEEIVSAMSPEPEAVSPAWFGTSSSCSPRRVLRFGGSVLHADIGHWSLAYDDGDGRDGEPSGRLHEWPLVEALLQMSHVDGLEIPDTGRLLRELPDDPFLACKAAGIVRYAEHINSHELFEEAAGLIAADPRPIPGEGPVALQIDRGRAPRR